jgi:hypothetical protein
MTMGVAMDAKTKAKKRARAKTLSRKIHAHDSNTAERSALWVELFRAGVDANTLGRDSGVQNQAVRKVLRRAGAM